MVPKAPFTYLQVPVERDNPVGWSVRMIIPIPTCVGCLGTWVAWPCWPTFCFRGPPFPHATCPALRLLISVQPSMTRVELALSKNTPAPATQLSPGAPATLREVTSTNSSPQPFVGHFVSFPSITLLSLRVGGWHLRIGGLQARP